MSGRFTGFVVFDLETTGFSVAHHHRVIEIGIVRLDEDLEVVEEWETLINPDRDIGATKTHGITASDVREAPSFSDLAADIWHRFEGAIPVSHNFSFDRRFIVSEFSRTGIELDEFGGLCTMRLAGDCGISSGRRKLTELCRHLSIRVQDAHCAGNDAKMCAEILKRVADEVDLLSLAKPVSCPVLWRKSATPLGITRKKAREAPIRSPLQTVAHRLTSQTVNGSPNDGRVDEYLSLLDLVLEDRVVDIDEADQLVLLAAECGLSQEVVRGLHERFVANLVALVLSDGVVTSDERRDLCRVAELLGISSSKIDQTISDPPSADTFASEDLTGMTVCFTGDSQCHFNGVELTRPIAEEIATAKGMKVAPRVTKKLDILVVANPDSSSSKAKKAREYGVRIIAERSFWQKLGIAVS